MVEEEEENEEGFSDCLIKTVRGDEFRCRMERRPSVNQQSFARHVPSTKVI